MPNAPAGKLIDIEAQSFGMKVGGRTVVISGASELRVLDLDGGAELRTLASVASFVIGDTAIVHSPTRGEPQVTDRGKTTRLAKPQAGVSMLEVTSIDRAGTIVGGSLVHEGVLWDAKSGEVLLEHLQKTGIDRTVVSPDGKVALMIRAKKPTLFVDVETLAITPLPGIVPKWLGDVEWSPDSATAVVWTDTEAIALDARKNKEVGRVKLNHADSCTFVAGHNAFLVGNKKRIVIFDTKTWKERGTLDVPANQIAATDAGDRVVIGQDNVGISVWDASVMLGAGKVVAKKKPAAKPRKKKVRGIFFGVPKTVTHKRIVDTVTNLHHILDRSPPEFAVRILRADKTRDRHWFHIVGSRGRNYLLAPWIECMQTDLETPLDVVLHVESKVEAKRYTTPFNSEVLEPGTDHVGALDIDDPVLVIHEGIKHGKRVTPAELEALVPCIELRWPD